MEHPFYSLSKKRDTAIRKYEHNGNWLQVVFFNRDGKWVERPPPSDSETLPPLPPKAHEEGRAQAPGYDIYGLEREWREFWVSSGKPKLANPARLSSVSAGAVTSGLRFNGGQQAMTTSPPAPR